MSNEVGQFIVLEGIDGSGTTTQAELLKEVVESRGREAVLTREPTTGPIGRFLRKALMGELSSIDGEPVSLDWDSMALLFSADRLDHVRSEIVPAIERGAVVISDRYDLSSLIYQSATSPLGPESLSWLSSLNERARRPDLTVVLNVSSELAEQRRISRNGKEEIYEKSALQRRLQGMYARASEFLPRDKIKIIQADGGIAEVQEKIVAAARTCPEFAWIACNEG